MLAHPDDLMALEKEVGGAGRINVSRAGVISAFVKCCCALEPNLVWADDNDRREWLLLTSELEWALQTWRRGGRDLMVERERLTTGVGLAASAWRGPSTGTRRELPFMEDAKLREIAERDLHSLESALKSDEIKVALVLAGSLVEAILIDVVLADEEASKEAARRVGESRFDNGLSKSLRRDPRKWTLQGLVAVAGPGGLDVLPSKVEQAADLARDWRNFVHPWKERTEVSETRLRPADAQLATTLVEMVIDAVTDWRKGSAS